MIGIDEEIDSAVQEIEDAREFYLARVKAHQEELAQLKQERRVLLRNLVSLVAERIKREKAEEEKTSGERVDETLDVSDTTLYTHPPLVDTRGFVTGRRNYTGTGDEDY